MFEEIDLSDLEVEQPEVEQLLSGGAGAEPVMLVDVREKWELTRGVLPGAVHRPMSAFGSIDFDWPDDRRVIIYCEHGVRSLDVAAWLRQRKGVAARSMRGGFAVWSGSVAFLEGADE